MLINSWLIILLISQSRRWHQNWNGQKVERDPGRGLGKDQGLSWQRQGCFRRSSEQGKLKDDWNGSQYFLPLIPLRFWSKVYDQKFI